MFTCSLSDGQTASQPAVSPSCARCRASKITLNNGLPHLIYEDVILETIVPLRHGDSFVLPMLSSLPTNMGKQVKSRHITATFHAR